MKSSFKPFLLSVEYMDNRRARAIHSTSSVFKTLQFIKNLDPTSPAPDLNQNMVRPVYNDYN